MTLMNRSIAFILATSGIDLVFLLTVIVFVHIGDPLKMFHFFRIDGDRYIFGLLLHLLPWWHSLPPRQQTVNELHTKNLGLGFPRMRFLKCFVFKWVSKNEVSQNGK